MMVLFLYIILLCIITSQTASSKDTVVTNLIVETTISAANRIENSEFLLVTMCVPSNYGIV